MTTQLGLTEVKAGRWRETVALLELAARQNPGFAERWYNLASAYEWTGQLVKAREACTQALVLNPKFAAAHELQTTIENELNAAKPFAPK